MSKPEQNVTLEKKGLTAEQIHTITLKAVAKLNWQLKSDTGSQIVAVTKMSGFSTGEIITIEIKDDTIFFTSTFISNPADLAGKNKKNIKNFDAFFEAIRNNTEIKLHGGWATKEWSSSNSKIFIIVLACALLVSLVVVLQMPSGTNRTSLLLRWITMFAIVVGMIPVFFLKKKR